MMAGQPGRTPLHVRAEAGVWEGFVPGVTPGALYKYRVASRWNGYVSDRADPYGFAAEIRPQTASKVVDLDAGCCGMAGSFGYAKDNYDVSRAIAERKLLPAVRAMQANSVLVAAGTSCRHQVEDFGSAHALHPAQLIAQLLRKPS